MGFRFRKSIKIAPGVKLNLNKKSVGVTAGVKGAHYTVNSKGKKTATVGIPGTGISFSESTSTKKKAASYTSESNSNNSSKSGGCSAKGCLTLFLSLIALAITFILYSFAWIPALIALIIFAVKKDTNGTKKRNILISTIVFITSLITMFLLSEPAATDLTISIPKSEYTITESAIIDIKVEPEDASVLSLAISDNDIAVLSYEDNIATLSFTDTGHCSIYLIANDELESNKIEFTVTDLSDDSSDGPIQNLLGDTEESENTDITKSPVTNTEADVVPTTEAPVATTELPVETTEVATQEEVVTTEEEEPTVWIPQSGSKYHSRSGCSGMENPKEVTLSEAKSMGYEPCKRCH